MKFPYRPLVTSAPDGIDFLLVARPEIPFRIVGPSGQFTYIGLVDTGSDHTILPASIARDLGIELQLAAGPSASVFSGALVQLDAGTVTLSIESDGQSITWSTDVCFFEFNSPDEETIVLGHAGFLDFFTAIFDGKLAELELIANDEMPAA